MKNVNASASLSKKEMAVRNKAVAHKASSQDLAVVRDKARASKVVKVKTGSSVRITVAGPAKVSKVARVVVAGSAASKAETVLAISPTGAPEAFSAGKTNLLTIKKFNVKYRKPRPSYLVVVAVKAKTL